MPIFEADRDCMWERSRVGDAAIGKWLASFFIVAAMIVIAAATCWFLLAIGTMPNTWSTSDLAAFGAYFGGVASPLLGLLTIAGLALALLMQNRQIEQVTEAQLAEQHIRMLREITVDLDALEGRHLTHDATLNSLLNGSVVVTGSLEEPFRKLLRMYVETLAGYASAVELYRTNITPYFDCRVFAQRGLRLLDHVEPHVRYLDQMGGATLAIIRRHLENTLSKRA